MAQEKDQQNEDQMNLPEEQETATQDSFYPDFQESLDEGAAEHLDPSPGTEETL